MASYCSWLRMSVRRSSRTLFTSRVLWIRTERNRSIKCCPGETGGQPSCSTPFPTISDSSRSNQLPRRAANNMANPAERHFINSFRKDLINMTREVNQVIDELFDNGVLSQEQYDTIRSKSTKQEQMRELYDYVAGWDEESKDQLYEALRKYNEPLIRKLRGS
ncbi:NACHT, LRR and PYD domains-containing protein 1a allele 5-like isoform X1 [Alligator mississippiensis]|uniref:NACHT, LRR and PYD domains-containing protein 1a allele 5-like isoform X1 n=2 Tax=Alligator mississippiensis TaxID=8496 RepID=UPI0009076651|nr:NACHT, LRR and PYD domains-containing protein 1a allele 5-like isoform X1 [Alligator mississippiensis]